MESLLRHRTGVASSRNATQLHEKRNEKSRDATRETKGRYGTDAPRVSISDEDLGNTAPQFLRGSSFAIIKELPNLGAEHQSVLWCFGARFGGSNMHQIIDFYHAGGLHHAYFFIEHRAEEIISKLKHFLENTVGVKTSGNPDFWHGKFNTLTIDHARDIADSSQRRDFSGGKKVFIIQADFITEEAQNALLKVFEEPTDGTHFFIISPQDILLPTLRSRMVVIESKVESEKLKEKSILNLKMKDRLAKVKEITDAISDEEKTKQDAIALLNQIEKELYDLGTEKFADSLKVCESARASLYDRGAPVKIILENLMLSI